jgi:hypothetical protein
MLIRCFLKGRLPMKRPELLHSGSSAAVRLASGWDRRGPQKGRPRSSCEEPQPLPLTTRRVAYIGMATGAAFAVRLPSYFFFDLRVDFRAVDALRFLPRFADLRAGFRAAALRTVERRLAAFLFLFAVIGIETTPST